MTSAVKSIRLNTSLCDGDLSFAANDDALVENAAYDSDFESLEALVAENANKRARAMIEFSKADSPSHHKTPIVDYLASRGVALPHNCISVRYRKAWQFDNGKTTAAMMALISDPITLEPLGLHLTYLRPNGEKWGRGYDGAKQNFWLDDGDKLKKRSGVIMLSPSKAVKASGALGIGEGVETALSLRRLAGYENLPVWAAGDSGNLAKFEAPPYAKHLIIAVDNDAAGIKAACELAERCQKLGVQITTIMHPKKSKDLNDLINETVEKVA